MKPFSLSWKQLSKTNGQLLKSIGEEGPVKSESTTHEYVTEFDSSKTPSESGQRIHADPPKKTEREMRNLDLPLRTGSSELSFEVESTAQVGAEKISSASFGLNLRKKSKDGSVVLGDSSCTTGVEALPFKKSIYEPHAFPGDLGFVDYDDVPVDNFAKVLLGGYGWSEGVGVGKTPQADVKEFQIKKRHSKEGIGCFQGMPDSNHKAHNSVDSNGQPNWICVGNNVRIVNGSDVGSIGKIIDLQIANSEDSLVTLKLSDRDENVNVRIHEIAELENCATKLKSARKQDTGSNGEQKRRKRDDSRHSRSDDGRKVPEREINKRKVKNPTPIRWLYRNIRVKIITKNFKGGRLYLKKGEVVDVVGPTTCDLMMDDEREVIQGVHQEHLETVLPHPGGCVLVLYGTHRGVLGSLEAKDLNTDIGVIRVLDTHERLKVRLEQIAEYAEDPDLLNY